MLKKTKNNHVDLLKKAINIKNLLVNPKRGGTPANDIKIIVKYMENEGIDPINFNSLKVLTYLTSKIKKIEKMLKSINM